MKRKKSTSPTPEEARTIKTAKLSPHGEQQTGLGTTTTVKEEESTDVDQRLPNELIFEIIGYALTRNHDRPVNEATVTVMLSRNGILMRFLQISKSFQPIVKEQLYRHNMVDIGTKTTSWMVHPRMYLPPAEIRPHIRSLHFTCRITEHQWVPTIHFNAPMASFNDHTTLRYLSTTFSGLEKLSVQFRIEVKNDIWNHIVAYMGSDNIVLQAGQVEIEVINDGDCCRRQKVGVKVARADLDRVLQIIETRR